MDRSLLITWYDLPAESRGAYLPWLHGSFMQKLSKRPGVLWAAHYEVRKYEIPSRVRPTRDPAVPRGNDFVLMLGAESSHAFAKPLDFFLKRDAGCVETDLSVEDRAMLALRKEVRTSLFTEEARVSRPEIAMRPDGTAPAPCIQLGSFNSIDWRDEEDMARWYAQWRLPSLKTLPGVIRVRKLVSVAGWAKHACFYEFTSLEARNEHFVHYETSRPDMEAWSKEVVRRLVHATPLPIVAKRTYPPLP